jgi:EmrB/QacA subfamily drug resistance transporter
MKTRIEPGRALALWRARFSTRPGWKWFILSTVLLGAMMSALDVSIVNVALPTLKRTFGVSMPLIEWVAIAYMLALTVFLPLFGKLADIFGWARLYNIGFVVFSVGSLLCGISISAGMLIASRVIQAIGAGLLQANSVAIITNAFPAGERGKAIGIQGAVQAVAMAVAPFIGGILITAVGWRSIFYVNIPIGIIGTLAALIILPTDKKKENVGVDYIGAALFAGGLGGILLGVNEAVKLGWESHTIIVYLLTGLALLSLFVVYELRVEHPLIDLRLFKNSTFLVGNLTGMLSYYILFAVMFLMPFYLERVRGYSAAMTGALITPLLLAMAVAAPFSGRISDRFGSKIMTTTGLLLSAMACIWMLFLGESAHMPSLVGMLVFMGLGMGMFIPSNNSAIMGAAPSEKLGVAGGLLNMTRSMGLIFGVNISGMVFTTLEHQYLLENGFQNVNRAFSNPSIPVPIKDGAFMHGFMIVISVLLAVNVLAAILSALRKDTATGIIDHDITGALVISSGFFNGFSQETAGMAILITAILFAGYIGLYAFARQRAVDFASSGRGAVSAEVVPAQAGHAAYDPKSIALAYYVKNYNDKDVSISVRNKGDHFEADVRKFGFLVKRLEVKGDKVTERRTGIRELELDQLVLVN